MCVETLNPTLEFKALHQIYKILGLLNPLPIGFWLWMLQAVIWYQREGYALIIAYPLHIEMDIFIIVH